MSIFSKSRRAGLPRVAEGPAVFVEERRVPKWIVRLILAISILQAAVGIGVGILTLHARFHPMVIDMACAWTVISSAVFPLLFHTLSAKTVVLADRIQIGLFAGPIKVWRHSYIWPAIQRYNVCTNWIVRDDAAEPGAGRRIKKGSRVIVVSPQGIRLMFDGDGLLLTLRDGRDVLIGSDNAERLMAVVRETSGAKIGV